MLTVCRRTSALPGFILSGHCLCWPVLYQPNHSKESHQGKNDAYEPGLFIWGWVPDQTSNLPVTTKLITFRRGIPGTEGGERWLPEERCILAALQVTLMQKIHIGPVTVCSPESIRARALSPTYMCSAPPQRHDQPVREVQAADESVKGLLPRVKWGKGAESTSLAVCISSLKSFCRN